MQTAKHAAATTSSPGAEKKPDARLLTPAQLFAVGEMQHALTFAGREIRRVHELALEHDISMTGINLEPLRAVYAELNSLVIRHLQARCAPPLADLTKFHAPAAAKAAA